MSRNQCSNDRNSLHAPAKRLVRRYVIPAIYIEEEIHEMPQRVISRIRQCSDEEQDNCVSRRCSNTTMASKSIESPAWSTYSSTEQSSSRSNDPKSTTSTCELEVQPNKIEKLIDELKLDLSSLVTDESSLGSSTRNTPRKHWTREDDESVQHCLKRNQRKQKPNKIAQMSTQTELQKVEQERENFKNWLARRKTMEQEMRRFENKLKIEEEKHEKEKKAKKRIENIMSYDDWLKKKRIEEIDKQRSQNLTVLTSNLAKVERMNDSEKAYKEWLEKTKLKPKPIPMKKGLEGLSLARSVSYVNPIPWKPNIEPENKPKK